MRSAVATLVWLVLVAPALADTVFLTNGKKFEDVVAERRDGELRIVLPYGEIVLPGRIIDRVERSRSVWRDYAEREAELRREGATAGAWLELARWADRAGYEAGFRRGLVRAAELGPRLEGLEPLMRRLGHIFDQEAGAWLSEREYMERRGYLLWGDRWLPREAYQARLEADRREQERRREDARQERIARAIEALAVAELRRAAQSGPATTAAPQVPQVAVFAAGGLPFVGFTPGHLVPRSRRPAPPQADFEDLVDRQPGSLFPVQPRRRHLTASE